ncbi:hypothetical protein [Nocardioides conyzicola]|uniref:Holin n=1 Tax=Nocardioides conyzicola TaxID=1651781 RepID=A0ABP8X2C5_9ACTN
MTSIAPPMSVARSVSVVLTATSIVAAIVGAIWFALTNEEIGTLISVVVTTTSGLAAALLSSARPTPQQDY